MMNREIRTEATDLGVAVFKDAAVWLPALIQASLRAGQPVIRDRRFENCTIGGPAVLLSLGGVQLDRCNLGAGTHETSALVLRPVSPTKVIGAVPFENCTFLNCDFLRVGFTGSEPFIEAILAVPAGAPQ